ncbi:ATP-binding protein [Shewanella olleyana]|uniref:sensor histidine kinase n=1 Tax=Shewanella olleyana TaxID=135626 RepID=UPI00200FF6CA|nr:histidine kinase dimerization/phospho-acceptor domain-containing protein [Shewanella olleyana]MCL1066334.1 ATP-binding protein [Shewanella olleyana]
MKSIRCKLLLWLVPGFVIVAILAGSTLYFTEQRRLKANLNNELNEFSRIMKLTLMRPAARFGPAAAIEQDFAASTVLKLNDVESGYYLQTWNENGQTLRKSASLGSEQLPRSHALETASSNDGIEFDSQLSFGGDIRVHSFSLKGGPRRPALDVSVAINQDDINQRLTAFSIQLIVGGVFFCGLLSAILVFAIKRALIPIQNLSEQVANVEAGSLHNRLIETDIPVEITPLVARLNQLLARLEQSFSRERQFNNDLAHELRTPLAAMRTTSEVALKWPEQSSTEDFHYIAESAAQLQQTIDSLLSLARIGNSGAQTLSEDVNIADLVAECLSLYTSQMQERNLATNQLVKHDFIIKSDPRLLRVIISNLISNAAEYAPTNSKISIDSESRDAVIRVVNDAPNLSRDDLSTMFDRLWRKDEARTDSKHVGLGLSIAYTAAQALSLELSAELHGEQLHMSLKLRN